MHGNTCSLLVGRDVARIGIADAVLHRDLAGHGRVPGGGARVLSHLTIRMKGCEVHRHVRPELLDDPLLMASISCSESFSPGISSVVISNQTLVRV